MKEAIKPSDPDLSTPRSLRLCGSFKARRGAGWLASRARRFADDLAPSEIAKGLATCEPGWRIDPPGAYCPRCGASAGPHAAVGEVGEWVNGGCAFCRGKSAAWDRIVRLGSYAPPISQWIKAMKHHTGWPWAVWLGRRLAEVTPIPVGAGAAGAGGDGGGGNSGVVVCPVPLHWTRRWTRGYNQSALAAMELAKARRWLYADLLRRVRRTPPQTSIAPSLRTANMRRAFAIAPVDLTGFHAIVVDDVKTSGATLAGCARLLRQAGARGVYAAVVAVADPKGRDFKVL